MPENASPVRSKLCHFLCTVLVFFHFWDCYMACLQKLMHFSFFFCLLKKLITYCSKLRVVQNFIRFLGIFCLMPGYTVTYSECFLYRVVFREGANHKFSKNYLKLVKTLERDTKQTNCKVKFLISKMMQFCMAGGWLCGASLYSNNSDQYKTATEQMQNRSASSVVLRSANQAAVWLQKGVVTTGLSRCLL